MRVHVCACVCVCACAYVCALCISMLACLRPNFTFRCNNSFSIVRDCGMDQTYVESTEMFHQEPGLFV